MPSSGVFNFTTVNIPAGVTVRFAPNAAPRPDVPEVLVIEDAPVLPQEPIWSDTVEDDLHRLTAEWSSAPVLREAGLTPVRTVLLHGPPGVGKSLAALWLAQVFERHLVEYEVIQYDVVAQAFAGFEQRGDALRLHLPGCRRHY